MFPTYAEVDVQSPGAFMHSLPAQFLKSGLNIRSLRTNTLLTKDEWSRIDGRVVEVSATALNGIADLRAAGLTVPLGGLGVMISQYERISDMTGASINMSADVDDEEDRLDFGLVGVPVPIISKSFRIDIRTLAASRASGGGLDTSHIDVATRKVAEAQETMLFAGAGVVVAGQPIYGYLNHPTRNIVAGGATWATATNIFPNFLLLLGALIADGKNGPYHLYLHPDQFMETMALVANTASTVRSLIESVQGMGPGSISSSLNVTAGTAILVQMSSDVVDLAIGQETVPVEWETKGGLVTRWKVLSAMVPRVKAHSDGRSGVATLAGI